MVDGSVEDAELLVVTGWSGVPSARICARAATPTACVLALDSNGGGGGRPYVTIEMLTRAAGDGWASFGDWGPAGG